MYNKWIHTILAAMIFSFSFQMLLAQQSGQLSDNLMRTTQDQRVENETQRSPLLDEVVDLDIQNATVKQALNTLANQANLKLVYSERLLPHDKLITIKKDSMTLYEALWSVLDNTGLQFAISSNRLLVLVKKQNISAFDDVKVFQETVSGTVVDAQSGEALPGVNIVVAGTTIGTTTNMNGEFELEVPSLEETLVFSFVGYVSQEVPINNQTELNIELTSDVRMLEDLVVIGYGTMNRSDLTGSVTSLSTEEFNKGVSNSVDELISGRSSGVLMTRADGEPGSGFSVRIRGSSSITAGNEPLYVVDGFPIDNSPLLNSVSARGVTSNQSPRNPLNSLNPSDIESIEILKDASATAIYGSRGANGVILITTKSGANSGVEVDYNFSTSIQSVANKLDVLNRDQYINTINEIAIAQGEGAIFSDDEIREIESSGVSTNWQNQIFQKAPIFNHGLTVSGGQNQTRYFASINYYDQEGVVINSGMKKYIARLNLNQKVGEKFEFGLNINSSLVDDNYVAYGQGGVTNAGVINNAIDFEPTEPIFDSEGNYSGSKITPDVDHAVAVANEIDLTAKTNRTLASVFAQYQIQEGLLGKIYFGADRQTNRLDSYVSSKLRRTSGISTAEITSVEKNSYIFESTFNYNKAIIEGHSIDALAGFTFQEFEDRLSNSEISGFFSDLTKTNNLSLGDPATANVGSNTESNTLLSYLGRINYNILDRYLITGSYRIDGSSRFGENNKFGFFPSIAVGWRLSNEQFISQLGLFDNLKLRLSWGKTGNQSIPNFASLGTLSGGQAVLDDQLTSTAGPARLPNPDLKWETTEQINLGIDVGFFDGRISGALDVYRKRTDDLLLNLPVPLSSGFGSVLSNVGSVKNEGIELMLETDNIRKTNFSWSTTFNFSHFRNEVISLGEGIDNIVTGQVAFTTQFVTLRPGEPMFAYWGHRVIGIFQDQDQIDRTATPEGGAKPGNPIYADINNDGIIDDQDRTVIGSPFPDYTFGINNSFNYKNFQLDVFIEGRQGSSVLSNNLMLSLYPANTPINRLAEPLLNRWTPENPSNKWPSSVNPSSYGVPEGNELVIQDNSYIRLSNVRLNYQIPVEKIKALSSASAYISGQNLITWTDYIGFDPEVSSSGSSGIVVDYNAYPRARTFTFGINVGF